MSKYFNNISFYQSRVCILASLIFLEFWSNFCIIICCTPPSKEAQGLYQEVLRHLAQTCFWRLHASSHPIHSIYGEAHFDGFLIWDLFPRSINSYFFLHLSFPTSTLFFRQMMSNLDVSRYFSYINSRKIYYMAFNFIKQIIPLLPKKNFIGRSYKFWDASHITIVLILYYAKSLYYALGGAEEMHAFENRITSRILRINKL